MQWRSALTDFTIGNKNYNQVKIKTFKIIYVVTYFWEPNFQEMHKKVIFKYIRSKVELGPG